MLPATLEPNEFVGRSSDWLPAGLVLSAHDLSERVATADAVEEAEGIADIALSAGVGTDD